MAVFLQDADCTLYCGDVLETLRTMPDESVHMCATSPPFYGLRDYGTEGQIGLEATPDLWVARLVEVFREVRRVLRSDGSLWVEIGDSYAQKDLIGAPWLLAFALRADGWYLRSEIIWAKPNPMPESVSDRPTVSHSRVFLLTKSVRYFYDAEAIREPHGTDWIGREPTANLKANGDRGDQGGRATTGHLSGRNRRSVWTVSTQPYPEAHFATWPEKLVEPMILAGCPEGGVVLDPFAGSGTTLHVARKLGRRSIGVELNAEYCGLAARRLAQQSLEFT